MHSQTSLVAQQIRLKQWAEQINSCQSRSSDMRIEDWCAQNGITKATYFYRLKRVREACLIACKDTPSSFVELPVPINNYEKMTTATNDNHAANIHLPNGITLELLNSASSDFIKNILGAVAYVK